MPELPEVEVVRRGLEKHLVGLHFTAVEVLDSRPLRKHVGGPASFVDQLVGRQVQAAVRAVQYVCRPDAPVHAGRPAFFLPRRSPRRPPAG